MRRLLLPLPLPCLLLPPLLLLLLLLPAEVRCTIACTGDCISKNITAETGTSSNDSLSVNSASGNKTYGGGESSGDVSLSDGAISAWNNVTRSSPVLSLKAEYVGETSINLTWVVNDTASSSYTYRIEVENGTSVMNLTSSLTEVEITGLIPGTMYNFTVFARPVNNISEEEGLSISLYTKPSLFLDLKAEYAGADMVSLTWTASDSASNSYVYRIEVINGFSITNLTCGVTKTEIRPSPVLELKAGYVGETSINLTWVVNDTASSSYTYRIEVENGTPVMNLTSSLTEVEITELTPGTMYNFTVFAVVAGGQAEGEGVTIMLYTRPSPVLELKAGYVGETSINLTWVVNDTASSSYTYRIEVENGTPVMNLTSSLTEVEITELTPGTMYNFTVFAVVAGGQAEGEGVTIMLYTRPSPVLELKAGYVGETSINLTWVVNDTASSSYTYRIEVESGTPVMNLTSSLTEVEITELTPGTMYNFTVFAVVAGGQAEGEGVTIMLYTRPSPVLELKAGYVGETSINLTWVVNDTASSSYTYRIEVENGTPVMNLTSSLTEVEITELTPGTMYNFTVFAVVAGGQTEGEGVSISQCTRPSPVLNLKAEYVGETYINLTWVVNDTASSSYTYRIEVENGTPVMNLTSSLTEVEITGLIPGTTYTFTVFAVVADCQTEGEGVSITHDTTPVVVSSFRCEAVAKQPFLVLKWECPSGKNAGFRIGICNNTCEEDQLAPPCMKEGSEETFRTALLKYFHTYNITIETLSNTSKSHPAWSICTTSITDPPSPSTGPLVKVISHSSLSVEFSDFESVNGPLQAYAVMITTEEQDCQSLKLKLNNTYKDFKKRMTVTYVTYVMEIEQPKSPSVRSQSHTNTVSVGNGNRMYGYENGPLIPLRSYRASVAGFTNITFTTAEIIVGEDSYVSFSPCSEAVLLPQDPGVIAGAVIGCLLAILAVVAVVGFIFWRRRRKDKRNTEVSFSPIKIKKSKLIKVENFESYFKKQQADSSCGFAEEYEELKSAGVHQPKFAAELAENRGKNRYNNVLPYDISRVKLSDQSSATDDYINANYMPGYSSKKAFIAAQGPLPNTIEDFWRMIWEKNIYSIVMLTKCVEQARTKCEQYWPDKQPKSYGDIIVTMVSEIVLPEWTIRDFTVEKANTPESHTVRQFHFTSWPDHGVPETTDLLINFRHLVHEYSSQNPIDSPTLVHCSAGVGRTGTFIAIDRLIQQMEMENTVDVYGVVYDLRMHRPLMVQTEDQYIFLNQCVMDIIRSQKDKKTDLIYQNMTAMAIYENFTPGPGFGKANGYHA